MGGLSEAAPPTAPGMSAAPSRPFSPPWAAKPWVQLSDGRVRLDLSNVAALVTAGSAVLLLVVVFLLGVWTGGPDQASAPAAGPTPDKQPEVADVRGQPPQPGVLNPGPRTESDWSSSPGLESPDGRVRAATRRELYRSLSGNEASVGLVSGRWYVTFQAFGANLDAAQDVARYLNERHNFQVIVRNGAPEGAAAIYMVRTAFGASQQAAGFLKDDMLAAMEQLNRDLPGRIRYEPGNVQLRPYAWRY